MYPAADGTGEGDLPDVGDDDGDDVGEIVADPTAGAASDRLESNTPPPMTNTAHSNTSIRIAMPRVRTRPTRRVGRTRTAAPEPEDAVSIRSLEAESISSSRFKADPPG